MRESSFDLTVRILQEAGFTVGVTVEKQGNYRYAQITGKEIHGGFCEQNHRSYSYVNARVAADHVRCFNRWAQCPLIVALPFNETEAKRLVKHLEWLGTEEAYKWSNSYGYIDDPRLPRVRLLDP